LAMTSPPNPSTGKKQSATIFSENRKKCSGRNTDQKDEQHFAEGEEEGDTRPPAHPAHKNMSEPDRQRKKRKKRKGKRAKVSKREAGKNPSSPRGGETIKPYQSKQRRKANLNSPKQGEA